MTTYTLDYLLSPDLNKEQTKQVREKIKKEIENRGKIKKSRVPKKINLAYPIQEKPRAFLGRFIFEVEAKALPDLRKFLETRKHILRILVTKKQQKAARKKQPPARPQSTKEKKSLKSEKKKKVDLDKLEKEIDKLTGG